MKRIILFIVILAAGTFLGMDGAFAQGGQDSVTGGQPRPRRDTYIIESYPSPAKRGEIVNLSYYAHNPQETYFYFVDVNDKFVAELQPRKYVQNGVYKFTFNTRHLATGSYFLRLVTYTSTGAQDKTQNSRFVVLH